MMIDRKRTPNLWGEEEEIPNIIDDFSSTFVYSLLYCRSR
jgi:hypothetical protein